MLSVEELYKKYAATVYRYILLQTKDEYIAEELTQETFYQAVKNINKFEARSSVLTWLIGIAKNIVYQDRRKNKLMEKITVEIGNAKSAEREALDSMIEEELLQKIVGIGEPSCEVVQLRIFAEFSFREIGEIMGKSENWARVTFYRAKEKLRKEMDDNEI